MPSYKLTYFNGRGRAEVSRLIFALAGVEFEDKRIELGSEEWTKLKPNTPCGQLPVLEFDGKVYTQSRAIVGLLARQFGFYPSDNLEAGRVEELLSIIDDFGKAEYAIQFAAQDKKEELMSNFKKQDMPKYCGVLEKLLTSNGTGHFAGNKDTVADVVAFDFLAGLEKRHDGSLNAYPQLKALVQRVGNLPNIKAWIAKRPDTIF